MFRPVWESELSLGVSVYVLLQPGDLDLVSYLEEGDAKRDPGDDSQVGLHHTGHLSEAALHGTDTKAGSEERL